MRAFFTKGEGEVDKNWLQRSQETTIECLHKSIVYSIEAFKTSSSMALLFCVPVGMNSSLNNCYNTCKYKHWLPSSERFSCVRNKRSVFINKCDHF